MKLKKKPKKVHALALGTGYVESASWANMLVVHPKGFNSIQEALESLRAATFKYLDAQFSADRKHQEWRRQQAREAGKTMKQMGYTDESSPDDPEEYIENTWNDIIHGTLQDHGEMWEYLTGEGWLINDAWIGQAISKYGICWLDRSPELISESYSWGEKPIVEWSQDAEGKTTQANELHHASHHMHHIPKGVRRFRGAK